MVCHTIDGGDDVTLAVDEVGSGQPVMLVHGYSQSRLCWRNQFESDLTDDFRLVAMDNRGHGESDKPRDAYADSELWAEDVRSVLTELELDDVILVGWSYGGLVVLDYIEAFGTDRVTGLNLVGGVSEIGTETGNARLGPEYIDLIEGFVSTDAETSVETLLEFVDLCVYDDLSPADRYYMLGYNVVVPPHVRDSLRDRTVRHDADLTALDIPVLLTHGEEDAVVVPAAAREYADLIDDATLSMYPETGHSPFWEHPDQFNRELREFALRS
ncbi:alpha/beta fold hydrolase [Haladaptatus halobius]|uniref:alpha/beta fold hydrolase n=1 Tax=Haladaptatus halobius TaxID=2884875 RepID=UPI001D0B95AB|nr:alpha/beta hydrolase [Haladaptatus halobius]